MSAVALTIALLGWTASLIGTAPAIVEAASCKGASHVMSLSDGRASPGNGSTSTRFVFSVRYTDNANCAPTRITVTIAKVGTFPLSGPETGFSDGAIFSVSRKLPAGVHAYSFAATSGTGAGERTATFTAVQPKSVTVAASAPTPRPASTPVPTPVPTQRAVPSATPRRTETPPPTESATLAPVASATPPGSPDVTSEPTTAVIVPVRPTPSSGPSIAPAGAGTGTGGWTDPFSDPTMAPLGAWLASSLAGVALLTFMTGRRRSSPVGRAIALELPGGSSFPGLVRAEADTETDQDAAADATLPRWLRPSVQTARRSGSGAAPYEPMVFTTSPAKGTERLVVGYRMVRLSDGPDDLRSTELGRLDRGDEVDILGFEGGFAHVRTPAAVEGWIPRHTLMIRRADERA